MRCRVPVISLCPACPTRPLRRTLYRCHRHLVSLRARIPLLGGLDLCLRSFGGVLWCGRFPPLLSPRPAHHAYGCSAFDADSTAHCHFLLYRPSRVRSVAPSIVNVNARAPFGFEQNGSKGDQPFELNVKGTPSPLPPPSDRAVPPALRPSLARNSPCPICARLCVLAAVHTT